MARSCALAIITSSRSWTLGSVLGVVLAVGAVLTVGAVLNVGAASLSDSPTVIERGLEIDGAIEESLAAQSMAVHSYTFEVPPGRWILELEQLQGDTVLELWRGEEERLMQVDSLFDAQGWERLAYEVETPWVGAARVNLRSGFAHGRYRLVLRPGSDDPRRWAAELSSTQAGLLAARVMAGGDRQVIEATVAACEEALEAWRSVDDRRRVAELLHSLGNLHRKLDRTDEAVTWMEEALAAWRRLEDDAFTATALNHLALLRRDQGDAVAAEDLLTRAVELYRRTGHDHGAQVASFNLCRLLHRRGAVLEARQCYLRILPGLAAGGSARHLGNLLNSLGGTYYQLGEAEPARRYYDQAMEQHLLSGDLEQQAAVLNNRAALSRYLGFWGEAVVDYRHAIELQRRVGDVDGEGRALNNLGNGLLALGELEQAQQALEQALELRRRAQDLAGQAVTLTNLGSLYHAQGNPAKALAFRRRALELRRELGLVRDQALTQLWMSRDLRALGRPQEALETLQQALERLPEAGDRRFAAHAWSDRGRLLLDMGEVASGIESLRRGLAMQIAVGDRWGEVESRVSLTEAELAHGDRQAAAEQAEAAISAVEALRLGVPDVELRATFLAAKGRAYELAVEIAMARYRQDGDPQHQRRALALSEMSRARSLIDLLEEAALRRSRPRDAVDLSPGGADLDELRRLTSRQLRAASRGADAVSLVDLASQIEALRQRVESASQKAGALGRSLTVTEIQQWLDPDSVLLEIALGERQSFLWTVTTQEVRSYALPPRQVLEPLAVAAHRQLSTQRLGVPGTADQDPLAQLSRHLLSPLTEALRQELAGRRLLVVADGALHYVPFAVLRSPLAPGEPLIERHEVLHLPSASTLAVLRRPDDSVASLSMLLLADPVFDRRDPRLSAVAGRRAASAAEDPGEGFLPRLAGSGREAQLIAALLPVGAVNVASGFDAQRQRLSTPEAARAGLLHVATHGLIDASRPSASGLMLSRWDEAGQPVDGFLSLEDIYGLSLQADLVVLSGCRTALGKEVRGEGLVGLSRGFLQAGSRAVVASLWQVEDAATAELMEHFYRALVQDHRSPSAALRLAQRHLMASERFHDPFFWAAFVVQGDGRWRVTLRSGNE